MMTPDQETMVADRIAFELIPDGVSQAWETAILTDGIGDEKQFEPGEHKKVAAILARDHGIRANPVNALYFRLAGNGSGPVTDPEVARRYLPNARRPAAGLRVQQGTDDPFAVLAANGSALRAATALPRAAQKLNEQVRSGVLSEDAKTELITTMRQRTTDAITPEVESAVRLMLPA